MALDKTLESPLDCKEIQPVHPKGDQFWVLIGRTDVEAETPILWPPDVKSWLLKRPWCWERLKAEGEEGDRGWDAWMASLMEWTWTWTNFGRRWGTGKPGMLQSMGLQRVGDYWVTQQEQNLIVVNPDVIREKNLLHGCEYKKCFMRWYIHCSECNYHSCGQLRIDTFKNITIDK